MRCTATDRAVVDLVRRGTRLRHGRRQGAVPGIVEERMLSHRRGEQMRKRKQQKRVGARAMDMGRRACPGRQSCAAYRCVLLTLGLCTVT